MYGYNNNYLNQPAPYQQPYQTFTNIPQQEIYPRIQQPVQPIAPTTQQETVKTIPTGLTWITENELDKINLPANSAAAAWDINSPRVYIIQTDSTGKPSVTRYKLAEENVPVAYNANSNTYDARSEIENLRYEIEKLKSEIEKRYDKPKGSKEVKNNGKSNIEAND